MSILRTGNYHLHAICIMLLINAPDFRETSMQQAEHLHRQHQQTPPPFRATTICSIQHTRKQTTRHIIPVLN